MTVAHEQPVRSLAGVLNSDALLQYLNLWHEVSQIQLTQDKRTIQLPSNRATTHDLAVLCKIKSETKPVGSGWCSRSEGHGTCTDRVLKSRLYSASLGL